MTHSHDKRPTGRRKNLIDVTARHAVLETNMTKITKNLPGDLDHENNHEKDVIRQSSTNFKVNKNKDTRIDRERIFALSWLMLCVSSHTLKLSV